MGDYYNFEEFKYFLNSDEVFSIDRIEDAMLRSIFIGIGEVMNDSPEIIHMFKRLGEMIAAKGKDVSFWCDKHTLNPVAFLLEDHHSEYIPDWMLTDEVLNSNRLKEGKSLAHIASAFMRDPWRFYTKEITFDMNFEENTPIHIYQNWKGLSEFLERVPDECFDACAFFKKDINGALFWILRLKVLMLMFII